MDKIYVAFILEILGKPKKHVEKALSELVEKVGAEKGANIINKTLHEPKSVKESKTLYTSFAELEIEFNSINELFGVLFNYMPAHLEIISPEKIQLTNSDLDDMGNTILRRLHEYDAIAKKIIFDQNALLNKLKEVSPDLFEKIKKKKMENKKSKK